MLHLGSFRLGPVAQNLNNYFCDRVYLDTRHVVTRITLTHSHTQHCSELCAAAVDDDESPFSPLEHHHTTHRDGGASQVMQTDEDSDTKMMGETDKDHQWIAAQLSKWKRYVHRNCYCK